MVSEFSARPVTGRHLYLHKTRLKSAGVHAGSVVSRGVFIFWLQAFVRFFFLVMEN